MRGTPLHPAVRVIERTSDRDHRRPARQVPSATWRPRGAMPGGHRRRRPPRQPPRLARAAMTCRQGCSARSAWPATRPSAGCWQEPRHRAGAARWRPPRVAADATAQPAAPVGGATTVQSGIVAVAVGSVALRAGLDELLGPGGNDAGDVAGGTATVGGAAMDARGAAPNLPAATSRLRVAGRRLGVVGAALGTFLDQGGERGHRSVRGGAAPATGGDGPRQRRLPAARPLAAAAPVPRDSRPHRQRPAGPGADPP